MSKLLIRKQSRSHRQIINQQDTRSHLRQFLTTIKNHPAIKQKPVVSKSLDLSPNYFKALSSPRNQNQATCLLPAIHRPNKKIIKTGITQFQSHIISNYLNAHLKVSRNISTIQQKTAIKDKKKNKFTKIKDFIRPDNTTIQEAEFQTLAEDKNRQHSPLNPSRKDYSLKEEPMKHYVKQKIQRKKREWKEKCPLQLVTYFYQLGPVIQKQSFLPIVNNNAKKDEQSEKYKPPPMESVPTFIKTYRPSIKQINIMQLIKKQYFTVSCDDSYLFFGEIKNGKRDGLGVLIKQDYLFEGTWRNDQKLKGIQKTSVGTFTGSYKNDKKQGKGQFRWANGQLYSGQWAHGKKHGVGLWVSKEGDSYMGEWKKGIVQGEGVHKCKSGQRYEGSFKNFLKHGWGKEHFPNGDYFEGSYCQGLPHGDGFYKWHDETTYEGQFSNGVRQGKGTLKNPKGFYFSGNFVEQFAEGNCQINYGNGDFYTGELKRGKRNGKGTLRQSLQRKIFDGYWKDDQLNPNQE